MKRTILGILVWTLCIGAGAETTLGVEGKNFTINGKTRFLLGASYYGALGAPKEFIRADLDDMQKYGFNWIRVWATWSAFENDVSAVDGEGRAREPYLENLKRLIGECDRRAMIVDVTLTRGGRANRARLSDLKSYSRAVRTLVGTLKPYRNWYIDLANERNVRDSRFVSFEELAALRKLARELDPKLLVTASHAGDIGKEDLRKYLFDVRVDFISPHRPRNANSPRQTADQTKRYLAWMAELGRTVPVHYQEPFRRGFRPGRFEPNAEHFLADLEGAIRGGAAGWCFHNGDRRNRPDGTPRHSFDMRKKRLFDQLDTAEQKFLRMMNEKV